MICESSFCNEDVVTVATCLWALLRFEKIDAVHMALERLESSEALPVTLMITFEVLLLLLLWTFTRKQVGLENTVQLSGIFFAYLAGVCI